MAAGAGAAAALGGPARAQSPVTLRWWGGAGSPAQLTAFKAQIAAFEAANPNIKVVFEPLAAETYPTQLATAFSSKQLPHIVTHIPSFATATYWTRGLVAEFTDVIKAIGEDDYFPGANRVYQAPDGRYFGTPIGNTAADMLWVRKDLMQRASIDKIPETWDELRAACRKMQGRGVFGAPLPYGLNGATSLIIIGFIHRAGGTVFSPDLEVAIHSPETVNALEFYKSMRELCPSGATNYSWGEMVTGFVSGACATGIYGGRVLQNVSDQNPGIADNITCTEYPTISKAVQPWTFNDFPCVFIPNGIANLAEAKAFAAFLFKAPGYVQQVLAAPGHIVPVLKSIASDPTYKANAIIKKYPKETDLMAAAAAAGFNLGFESTKHKQNAKAGQIIASNVLSEMVQRVALNGDNIKTVLGDTSKKLDTLMKA